MPTLPMSDSEEVLTEDALRSWIGRQEQQRGDLDLTTAERLAATLNRPAPPRQGDPLPPLWHWAYFQPTAPAEDLGYDGHPAKGDFLPPLPLPRRMWAGSRLRFESPLRLGEAVEKTSTLKDVRLKQGRSGVLGFVTVLHELRGAGGGFVCEEHDIVYRAAPTPGETAPLPPTAPQEAAFSRRVDPDAVLLFRYSAVTFNGHRIHYDRSFCTQQEGYPGLVVHGPLTATLLLQLLTDTRPEVVVADYAFRAVSPLFDGAAFTVNGRCTGTTADLWATGPQGQLAMTATATFTLGDSAP